jgi:hypothetical protein
LELNATDGSAYPFSLELFPKDIYAKGLSPFVALLIGGRTFRRWDLMEGSWVTGSLRLKGIW